MNPIRLRRVRRLPGNPASMGRRPVCPAPAWAPALAAAALCAGLAAAPPAQALVGYVVTDLGSADPVAGVNSIAVGINNAGDVIGNNYDRGGQQVNGWLLRAGEAQGSFLAADASFGDSVRAATINNNGLVVGVSLVQEPLRPFPTPYQAPQIVTTLKWSVPATGPLSLGTRVAGVPDGWQPMSMNDSGTLLARGPVVQPGGTVITAVNRVQGGLPTRVWESQGYPTTMPLAINNAGDMVGGLAFDSPIGEHFTAINNTGLRLWLDAAGQPFLWWREPDGSLFNGSPAFVERTAPLESLLLPNQTRLIVATSINDLGQIAGRSATGHAAVLSLAGTLDLVVDAVPLGSPIVRWDTPLYRLPNWKSSGMIDVVIAPTHPAGANLGNTPFAGSALDDLNNANLRSLTVGQVGAPAGPGAVFNTVSLGSMNLRMSTGAVTVGNHATLQLDNTGIEALQGGVVNLGRLWLNAATLRGNLANHGGTVTVADGSSASVQGDLDNDLPVGAPLAGGLTLWVNPGARLSVTGDVRNSTIVQVMQGARLDARSFTQTAGQLVVNGALDTSGGDVVITGGGLYGSGVINAVQLTVGTNGPHSGANPFIAPGNSPGHLTINGALVLAANATLELQVERAADGSLVWDRLSATSIRFLDGSTVHFAVGSGVASAQLQTLDFLDCGSGCSFGSQVQFTVDGAPGATLQFGSSGLSLGVAPAQAVPEPATAVLWLAGLLALGRRRAGAVRGRSGPWWAVVGRWAALRVR